MIRELYDLSGNVALVTGGASNLGYDMALALAEAGADVALTSRVLENARQSAARLSEQTGSRAIGLACDVRFEDQVKSMVHETLSVFGKIGILVNNSGNVISTPDNAPLENRPVEEWENTVAVNMKGVFLCTKHVVAKAMKPAQKGTIVNIGSTAGLIERTAVIIVERQWEGPRLTTTRQKVG